MFEKLDKVSFLTYGHRYSIGKIVKIEKIKKYIWRGKEESIYYVTEYLPHCKTYNQTFTINLKDIIEKIQYEE